MPALIDPATGRPFARSVEVSDDIERRIQKIERRWYIRHISAQNYWALFERWKSDDPRRAQIRSGERAANADFDIVGQFDGNLTAEEVCLVMERKAERSPATKGEAARQASDRVDALTAKNEQVKAERTERFIHEQNEKGAKRTKHERELAVGATTAHPMSTSATPQHKRTDPIKGTDPDDRDPASVAMSGDFPFPTSDIDYTILHNDTQSDLKAG